MVNKLAYEEYSEQFLEQLPKGAFLTVKYGDHLNTMTIGWGSIGYVWQKPMLMVMVRYSRHTYELIEKSKDFSLCFPSPGELKKALSIAGTKSGRDTDKFKEANLTAQNARCIDSPIIGECELVFECKVVYKHALDPENLENSIREGCYPKDDFHVMYYGEIVACYRQDHK